MKPTFGLLLIGVVYGKAFYGQLLEQTNDNGTPKELEGPQTENSRRTVEGGLTNGVDINLKDLNNNRNRDIFNINFQTADHNTYDMYYPIHFSRQGLSIDWPIYGTFHPNNFILDNYFRINPNSNFLVQLDQIPDYAVVPQRYMFDVSMSENGLVDTSPSESDIKHNILTNDLSGPSYEVTDAELSAVGKAVVQTVIKSQEGLSKQPDNSVSNRNPFKEISFGYANINDELSTKPNIVNANSDSTKSENLAKLNNLIQNEPVLEIKTIDNQQNVHSQHKSLEHLTTVPNSDAISVDNRDLSSIKTEKMTTNEIGVSNATEKTTFNDGDATVNLASQQQANEVFSQTKLRPLTEIFGGESLFKPRPKVIKVFHMTPKQEALSNFQG